MAASTLLLLGCVTLLTMAADGGSADGGSTDGEVLVEDRFEDRNGFVASGLLGNRHVSIAPGQGRDGSDALRVAYEGYEQGSHRVVRHLPLPEAVEEATLWYDVKFEPGFQFTLGGKLHGLGPARSVTGGQDNRSDGWSARVMWRTEGRPVTYTYHQDRKGTWGEGGTRQLEHVRFEPGRWHRVALHVRINSDSQAADGFVRLYVDGELVEARQGVRFRGQTGRRTLIHDLMFSTFHGGSRDDWAPKAADGNYATVHALFDNMRVTRGGPAVAKEPAP